MTRHIFLSPHLDDIPLSCGGLLAQLTRRRQPVAVITLFAGLPEADAPLSPFAQAHHRRWGALQEACRLRRAEDEAALSTFGLKPVWLPFLDAIYRGQPDAGQWYYPTDEALFGPPHPAEAGLPARLADALRPHLSPGAVLYAPLAAGDHVDHQLTVQAALQLARRGHPLFFYEDYPYVQRRPADLERALQTLHRLSGDFAPWRDRPIPLTEADLATKIRAIAAYASQMEVLFGGVEAMARLVTGYARQLGNGQPAERLWTLHSSEPDVNR